MSTLPFVDALARWLEVTAQLKALEKEEKALRGQLFAAAFPAPNEGTNRLELQDGGIVKGTYRINRSVDEAAVIAVKDELRKLGNNKITADDVFPIKHTLSKSKLDELPDNERLIASKAIVAKPGLPSLEVV